MITTMQIIELAKIVVASIKPLLINQEQLDDPIMDKTELAGYMRVSEDWIYKNSHKLPKIQIGSKGTLRFRRSEIDTFLKKHSTPGVPD